MTEKLLKLQCLYFSKYKGSLFFLKCFLKLLRYLILFLVTIVSCYATVSFIILIEQFLCNDVGGKCYIANGIVFMMRYHKLLAINYIDKYKAKHCAYYLKPFEKIFPFVFMPNFSFYRFFLKIISLICLNHFYLIMKIINNTIFCFVILLLSTIDTHSQNKLMDSLINQLSIHTKKDTFRVELLNTLAHNYRRYDILKAEEKSIEANNLAKKINDSRGFAKSVLLFSKIHMSKSEYDEALKDGLKSLKLYKNISNPQYKDLIAVYNTLGMISNYQNNSSKALEYFKNGFNVAKNNNNLRYQGVMLNSMGITYYIKGDLDEAINYYKKAIVQYEKSESHKSKLSTLNNIAIISSIQGRYAEALEYYNKIIVVYRKDNRKDDIALAKHNMGIIYSEIEQHDKAYTYFEESLQIFKELEDKLNVAKSLNSIGSVFIDLKEYKKGLEYCKKALLLNKEINNNQALISNYNALGNIYLLLEQPKLALDNINSSLDLSLSTNDKRNVGGSHVNLGEVYFILKKYTKALYHATKGKKMVDKLDMLSEQKDANHILSKIYEVKGESKKSLTHFKVYKKLNDSLFNKENIEKITQLEYDYKYKKVLDSANIRELKLTKTVKTTSQNLEKSQRNLFLGVIGFLITALILGMIILFLRLRNEKTKTQNIVVEQKLLRSQMTPHFIFNSLSVLQGMILNKEYKKALFYLSKFSKLLRITLENSRDKIVPLNQELEAVNNYLELQKLEESKSYKYTILVDETINKSSIMVPPMLMQPFIENAIEHAFENQKENQTIDVKLNFFNEELICTIKDNGIGLNSQSRKRNKDKKSLSTTITSERLKMLSKDFKMKGSISIEDRKKYSEQGTIVTLDIPYKINEA